MQLRKGKKHRLEVVEEARPSKGTRIVHFSSSSSPIQVDSISIKSKDNNNKSRQPGSSESWENGGAALLARVKSIMQACHESEASKLFPVGTRVWAKTEGFCLWPGIVWSLEQCHPMDKPQVISSFAACGGNLLVLYYGEHNFIWARATSLSSLETRRDERIRAMMAWARQQSSRHSKVQWRWRVRNAINELQATVGDGQGEVYRLIALRQEHLARTKSGYQPPCYICSGPCAEMCCPQCRCHFHGLCLEQPVLPCSPAESTVCPLCHTTPYDDDDDNVAINANAHLSTNARRVGLTPDWVIYVGAYKVLQLNVGVNANIDVHDDNKNQQCSSSMRSNRSERRVVIKGLLDPCTNSKARPNIPAEVLYDEADNGLDMTKPWAGHYVILNPEYEARIQQAFVRRAIDEVESGAVPAVILVCRASVETNFFRGLLCFPRVLMHRSSIQFKDYNNTPIGFGIAVFLIAKPEKELYQRFYQGFGDAGEASTPIDLRLIHTDAFWSLVGRLRGYASRYLRDLWLQCEDCKVWRIVSQEMSFSFAERRFTCADLARPTTSCKTPLSKAELVGNNGSSSSSSLPSTSSSSPGMDLPPKATSSPLVAMTPSSTTLDVMRTTTSPSPIDMTIRRILTSPMAMETLATTPSTTLAIRPSTIVATKDQKAIGPIDFCGCVLRCDMLSHLLRTT
jgi:PWWP domain